MPRRRETGYTYYVFVFTVTGQDTMFAEMVYHDRSLRRAQVAFAQAIMSHHGAYAVEIHRGLTLLAHVKIERRSS